MIKQKARFLTTTGSGLLLLGGVASGAQPIIGNDWQSSSFITHVVVKDPGKTGLPCARGTPVTLEVTGLGGAGDVAVSLSCADGKHFQKVRGKLEGHQEIKGCSNNLKPCSWTDLGFGGAAGATAGRSGHPGGMQAVMMDGSVRFQVRSGRFEKLQIGLLLPAVKKYALGSVHSTWDASSFQTKVILQDSARTSLRSRTPYTVEIRGVGGDGKIMARFFNAQGRLVGEYPGKLTGFEKFGPKGKTMSWSQLGFKANSPLKASVMGDGSVRFLSSSISPGVWIGMSAPALQKVQAAAPRTR